jgi:equilibrative nucleoside transporter 1/2/3
MIFSGCITPRIVWSLLTEILVMILTILLAMLDTSDFPEAFFYIRHQEAASYFS